MIIGKTETLFVLGDQCIIMSLIMNSELYVQ